jgi:hypothetical protein
MIACRRKSNPHGCHCCLHGYGNTQRQMIRPTLLSSLHVWILFGLMLVAPQLHHYDYHHLNPSIVLAWTGVSSPSSSSSSSSFYNRGAKGQHSHSTLPTLPTARLMATSSSRRVNDNSRLQLSSDDTANAAAADSAPKKILKSKKAKKSAGDGTKTKKSPKKKTKSSQSSAIIDFDRDNDNTRSAAGFDESEKVELLQAIGEEMRKIKQQQQPSSQSSSSSSSSSMSTNRVTKDGQDDASTDLLGRLNPFTAGQNLRKTIDTAFASINRAAAIEKKNDVYYYIDDRYSDDFSSKSTSSNDNNDTNDDLISRNPLLAAKIAAQEEYVPEVLVVGATGEVGRLVVRRLQLAAEGPPGQRQRFRIRVLVRDLYTRTLNMLGTGVTYCQGDLHNIDALEYALTDVDKIVFCASAPRPDEPQFRTKFEEYIRENLSGITSIDGEKSITVKTTSNKKIIAGRKHEYRSAEDELATLPASPNIVEKNAEWEQLDAVLEVRARLAEQVDCIGMQNLIRAYQNVRFADYGTSQAAKRSLFKFQDRPEDFNLFALDDDNTVEINDSNQVEEEEASTYSDAGESQMKYEDYDYEMDDEKYYDDLYGGDNEYSTVESRDGSAGTIKTRVQWIRNRFEHGVFVGRVPRRAESGRTGSEAAIVSTRLRSRDDPENGIDLGNGFVGFILRVCSDGRKYEAFVRTGAYYDDGIEYVCEFSSGSKQVGRNKSRNKFTTVRLPFASFKPIRRRRTTGANDEIDFPVFRGRDVRNIGFRYRSDSNDEEDERIATPNNLSPFYLAFCFIKLYRSQPEPEFVYVSDARIPPVVTSQMVRHDARQIVSDINDASNGGIVKLLDESRLAQATEAKGEPSPEEIYYKYRGEEILKHSGLSYAIIRIAGYNELPSGEDSTIELQPSNQDILSSVEQAAVSRAEVAQVCVKVLMDPNALNKSFYMSKTKAKISNPDMDAIKEQLSKLPADAVV